MFNKLLHNFSAEIKLFILIVGVFATVVVTGIGVRLLTRADEISLPVDLKISNLTENSATVSFRTDKDVFGFMVYSTDSHLLVSSQKDTDRVKLHYFTIKNLKPATDYYFKLGSAGKIYGQNNTSEEPYNFQTASIPTVPPVPDEAYGKVKKGSSEALDEIIVFATIKDQGKTSNLLSAQAGTNGNFSLDLGNARFDNDTGKFFPYSKKTGIVTVEVVTPGIDNTVLNLNTAQTQPIPDITIGEATGSATDISNKPLTQQQQMSQETRSADIIENTEAEQLLLLAVTADEIKNGQKPELNNVTKIQDILHFLDSVLE